MVRTLFITLGFLAIASAPAAAEPSTTAPVGMEVRGDDGTLLGRVTGTMRDAEGRLIGVEIAGQEPADAPPAAAPRSRMPEGPLVASNPPDRRSDEARMIRRDAQQRLVANR